MRSTRLFGYGTTRCRRGLRCNSSVESLEDRALLSTITVTSLADNLTGDGEVTLREAIKAANDDVSVDGSVAGSGPDTIVFADGLIGIISLDAALGTFVTNGDLTIEGRGVANTVLDGGDHSDVISVEEDGTLTISDVHITNGLAGIRSLEASVFVVGSQLTSNETGIVAMSGQIFHVVDVVSLESTLVSENGRGLSTRFAHLRVTDSVVSNNVLSGETALQGAGIHVVSGDTQIIDSEITGNSINTTASADGAGIYIGAESVVMTGSVVSGNIAVGDVARGGGIHFDGAPGPTTGIFQDTAIFGNEVHGETAAGGGIYGDSSSTFERAAVYNNRVVAETAGFGGGMYFPRASNFTLLNSTISGNTVTASSGIGDGIMLQQISRVAVQSSTIVGHSSGLYMEPDDAGAGPEVDVRSSVFANAERDLFFGGEPDRYRDRKVKFNFISNNEGSGLDPAPIGNPDSDGNMVGTAVEPIDPQLEGLADNGGRTLSHAPTEASPVVNRGRNPNGSEFDQRGEPYLRKVGSRPDIGSIELFGDIILEVSSPIVAEESGVMVFDVTFAVGTPTVIDFQTVDGSAVAGDDFDFTDGELSFSAIGETLQISVPLIDDALAEQEESMTLSFSSDGLQVAHADFVGTIEQDSDFGPQLNGGVLLVRGDATLDDLIALNISGEDLIVDYNGNPSSFPLADVVTIEYEDAGGDNVFVMAPEIDKPTTVNVGDGLDRIETASGPDSITTGHGGDTIVAGGGNDTVHSGRGRDSVLGGGGDDRLEGEGANDTLRGGDGDDVVNGGPGNDRIFGDKGDDRLIGFDGTDYIEGGDGDDSLLGSGLLKGNDGDDALTIGNGKANGGRGNDSLTSFFNAPDVTLLGASGSDSLEGGGGLLDGGQGGDTLILDGNSDQVIALGQGGRDYIENISNFASRILTGGTGNDTLISNGASDVLLGGAGNDRFHGGHGDDTIRGGLGNDRAWGDHGDDLIEGDDGDDLVNGGHGRNTVIGGNGDDSVKGRDGHDILIGGDGNDIFQPQAGRDLVIGGLGMDTLRGNTGEDILIAGTTTHGVSDLASIRDEWASEREQSTRAANIRDGSGGEGVNGSAFLNAATVADDGVADELSGHGGNDWFFARFSDDTLIDKLEEELFVDI